MDQYLIYDVNPMLVLKLRLAQMLMIEMLVTTLAIEMTERTM
jgi:hypothetical protein